MRHAAQPLLENQTRKRIEPVATPTQDVARKLEIILRRIISAQRQPEAILAARRSVTGAGITAADIERGDDLMPKARWLDRLEFLHCHRQLYALAARLDENACRPFPLRANQCIIHVDEA